MEHNDVMNLISALDHQSVLLAEANKLKKREIELKEAELSLKQMYVNVKTKWNFTTHIQAWRSKYKIKALNECNGDSPNKDRT